MSASWLVKKSTSCRLGCVSESIPQAAHEPQGTVDLVGEALVALALAAGADERLVPLVDARQVGEAALHERAEEVQRGGGLVVGLQQSLRVGNPRRRGGQDVVDDVPAERRELEAVDRLGVGRARLGELARDPPHLHDRDPRAVAQHDRHLEDHLQAIADAVGGEGVEGLGTVAGLEEERTAACDLGEGGGEVPRLAGEDEGRQPGELLERCLEGAVVGPRRLLGGHVVAPRRGGPGLAHRQSLAGRDRTGQSGCAAAPLSCGRATEPPGGGAVRRPAWPGNAAITSIGRPRRAGRPI